MAKHAADKPHSPAKGGRLQNYTGIEREEAGPHPQTETLQKRPKGPRNDGTRTKEFMRIERGGRA